MRAFFVATLVFLGIGISAAQTAPTPPPVTSLQILPSTPQRVFSIDHMPDVLAPQSGQDTADQSTPRIRYEIVLTPPPRLPGQATCYAMRAYQFSAATPGSAPQRTGYTTCVPSRMPQLRQTQRPAKLIPAQ